MREYARNTLLKIGGMLMLIGCLFLVINGQKEVSYFSLLKMLLGLVGILLLLFWYNRSWTKESHYADSDES